MENPYKNLVGKKVKIPRLFTHGKHSCPEMLENEWIVTVKSQNKGRILVYNDFVYNIEIPVGEVIEIM